MCGRFFVAPDNYSEQLREVLEALQGHDLIKAESFDCFPTDTACVIANNRRQQPRIFEMRWGFPDRKGSGVVINARSETASRLPMFCESARCRRCLIPFSGYYEWMPTDEGKKKFLISPSGGNVLFLAGLYCNYGASAPSRFVVLTRCASKDLLFIHQRMPVLLPMGCVEDWLSISGDFDSLIKQASDKVTFRAV
ncbi:MAG: SOS response-associated peptidase [Ruminococcaceae bacterium]|nr:SOS response-associated peptidase [Oscillospiraceae bacterium]